MLPGCRTNEPNPPEAVIEKCDRSDTSSCVVCGRYGSPFLLQEKSFSSPDCLLKVSVEVSVVRRGDVVFAYSARRVGFTAQEPLR